MKREPLTFSKLREAIRKLILPWLIVAVIGGLCVLGVHFADLPARSGASAVVNFSYSGIESGLDPAGNRFDVNEIKDEGVVRTAVSAAGLEGADIEKIRGSVVITAVLPEDTISRITKMTSRFGDSSQADRSDLKVSAYYPTQYQITFNYSAIGLGHAQGNALLKALLTAYQNEFNEKYGYNSAVEQMLDLSFVSDYDYEDAVDRLDGVLQSLNDYVSGLAQKDKSLFRSAATGSSFADLISGIDTVRSQDLSTLSSYIVSNNVTRDWESKRDRYNYLIEEAERDRQVLTEEKAVIDKQIESYSKTKAVVLGTATAGTAGAEGQEPSASAGVYQVTQQSNMLDNLLQESAGLVGDVASVDEKIKLYTERLEKLTSDVADDEKEYVEAEITRITGKIGELIRKTKLTAQEYFAQEDLDGAFSVVEIREGSSFPILPLIRASLADGVAVEAIILGVFLLLAILKARRTGKKDGAAAPEAKKA